LTALCAAGCLVGCEETLDGADGGGDASLAQDAAPVIVSPGAADAASGGPPGTPAPLDAGSGFPGFPFPGRDAGPSASSDAAAAAPDAGSAAPSTPRGSATCLQPGNGKFDEPGPYKVAQQDVDLGMIEPSQATGMATIFYPNPLEANCPHPIVAWGNGTAVDGSDVYAFFNSNAAAWGMVVIASHESNTGSGKHLQAGIDYLLKQNQDASSPFYKKLSTRAGTGGHSQGGMGATVASAHPNVEALVSVAGGGLPGKKVATLCLTGTEDLAEASCVAEYQGAPGPAFLADWQGGDHVSTETLLGYITGDAGSRQMQRLYAAWFRCFLADDKVACALFQGAPSSCGLCKDNGWSKLESRNM
jgi:hypothetical protein